MRYKVSTNLVIQFNQKGQMVASASMSRRPKKIQADGIFVLQAFGTGNTPEEAQKILAEECEFDEEGFYVVLDQLLNLNYLVPADNTAQEQEYDPSQAYGFASVRTHHHMLRDSIRVLAYKNAIAANVKGKSVLEIGCGSGILSLFAAQAGAEQVTAVEESEVAELAKEMIHANQYDDTIEVITKNSRDVKLKKRADVIIHELIGVAPFGEKMLSTLADARERFLAKDGRFIPYKLDVFCCGIQTPPKNKANEYELLKEANEFSGQYGLDFTPFIQRLSQKESVRTPQVPEDTPRFPHPVLTKEQLLYSVDFTGKWDDIHTPRTHTLTIEKEGSLNALVIFFRAYLDEHTVLTNSPYAPKTHWGWEVVSLEEERKADPGAVINISTEVTYKFGNHKIEATFA